MQLHKIYNFGSYLYLLDRKMAQDLLILYFNPAVIWDQRDKTEKNTVF